MAIAPQRSEIGIRRHFTTEGVHPYDSVVWERRDARITNFRDGTVAFEQLGVEVPESWSVNATNILAQKYFRGTLGTAEREWSLKQVADRVADTITRWGLTDGYFVDADEATVFNHELKYLIIHQKAAFNSPVWFNIGVAGVPQQGSACQPFDALVSTPGGLVPIGELVERNAVGDKVLDAHGVTRIIAVKANGQKNVLRITTKAGHQLDVTADHLVWRVSGQGTGAFVPAGELRAGDALEWHSDERFGDVEIDGIDELGEMEVYDIQTESGEYLSGDLRVHNCFILSVDDTMDSILNWYTEEGVIFKGGSGAGVNLSKIRSSAEHLKGGGTASGPVSFMRGADASAGTIKSGGKTRRAAKMVILDADHPDVEDFIWCKAIEERKARVLRDAGFDMDLDGKDSHSTQYQNANNSVRVTDEFMEAVIDGRDWNLLARTDGSVVRTVPARDLFRQIAHSAWECADPGLQYDTTINRWHTAPVTGRINGSNPCSEYVHLDNSACNLASMNLLTFLDENDEFDVEGFKAAVTVVFTGQEIIVGNADYPTERIGETTRAFRELGIGYANLGALLMAQGLPYDSDAGRAWAAAITALLTGHAYATSARTAARMGPFAGYHENGEAMLNVLRMHQAEAARIDEEVVPPELLSAAQESWDVAVEAAELYGVRNSQASVLAPTGTIGLLMDCDTTGVEPDLGLVKTKKLVGGGTMSIVNQTIPRALVKLGYGPEQIDEIVAYVNENMSILGAPHIRPEHLAVFACSMGDNTIHYQGHIKMMGAVQPFISGAISKTVNMPEDVTVEDVEQLHIEAWRLGIKAVAIYRDNCKVAQPLSTTKKETTEVLGGDLAPAGSEAEAHDRALANRIAELESALEHERQRASEPVVVGAVRERLPRRRNSKTFSFRVADCEGYVTVGEYEDGRPGEIFVKVSKQGSTLAGIMDAFSISISLALQHQVPLATFVRKYANMKFEPAGITDDADLRIASSLLDYIFRRLALDYLTLSERTDLGVLSTSERTQPTLPGVEEMATPSHSIIDDGLSGGSRAAEAAVAAPAGAAAAGAVPGVQPLARAEQLDAPYCYSCGNVMQRAGSCYVCGSCGTTSGCS
jgi:ribonucleoside-diphosphate reductase alpha chain